MCLRWSRSSQCIGGRNGAATQIPTYRTLSQSSQDDPQMTVLVDYSETLREALRADGMSSFELAGIQLYDELERLEPSLRRCQKKGAIPS